MQVRSGSTRKRPKVLDDLREAPPRPAWGRDRFRPSWARAARRAPRIVHDTLAVTPVIGTVMVLAISVIGIAAVLTWGLPNIQQTQASTEIDGILEEFYAFDQVAEQVVRGGAIGKASEAKFTIPSGYVERKDSTLFAVSWAPHHADFSNTERFYVEGLDDGDPQTFTVRALDPTNVPSLFVEVARAKLTTISGVTFQAAGDTIIPTNGKFDTGTSSVSITLAKSLYEETTRIQVSRDLGNGDERLVWETWIFPLGALEYVRPSNIGNHHVILENSAVITETDGGRFMHTEPLVSVETGADGPEFVAFFPMLLAEHPDFPAVQAAGAGTYPLLWALAGNTLRVNGLEAVSAQVKVIGDRGPLWMQHFTAVQYGFTPNLPADPSVQLDGGTEPFNLVVMESTVEVTMKQDFAALQSP